MGTPISSGSGSWQAEARRMRAQGKASDEIAALIGKTVSAVRAVLRGTPRPPAGVLGAGARLVEPHAPRTPRVILDQDTVRSATADFAAGRIDRDELLRRIAR